MDAASVIKRVRQEAGLSQRALAELAGTSPAAICFYERGTRVPRVDTLRRIVEAAGSELHLATSTPPIDVRRNARDLEAVLELADHLPGDFDEELPYPVFADLANR